MALSTETGPAGIASDSRMRGGLALAIPILLTLVVFSIPFAAAVETALHFSGVAIDGPFQLYNALRRIDGGFRPGVGFQFFHGIGIPYLHYPFYRLFGGTFAASELSRQLIACFAYPLVFLALFRAFTGDWRRSWYLTAAALAVSIALHMTAVMAALNGMLGLRSALPTLFPLALFLPAGRRSRILVPGVLLGVALFMSTEQGMALWLAYVLGTVVVIARTSERRRVAVDAGVTMAIGGATLLLALLAVGGFSGARGALHYNFGIVPRDQYWYFGAPPNVFLASWRDVVPYLVNVWPVGLAITLGIAGAALWVTRLWRLRDSALGGRTFALTVLALYGIISTASLLGIFTVAYATPCWRVVIVLGLLEIVAIVDRQEAARGKPAMSLPLGIVALVPLALVWMLIAAPASVAVLTTAVPHVLVAHVTGREGFGVAGIWPKTLAQGQEILNARRGPDGRPPSLWSTYAGWLEARNVMFHPSFDYIIHALGPENRARYLETFRAQRPRLVQTVLPTYTQYEAWIEGESWPFYADILRDYAIVGTTPWSIFWERQATSRPGPTPVAAQTLNQPVRVLNLPPVPPPAEGQGWTVLDVELTYEVRNPLRFLPLVGASPRYLVGIIGAANRTPISLSPYDTTVRFPVIAAPGTSPSLVFDTFSLLPGASFRVHSARVSALSIDPRNAAWLADLVRQQSGQ